MIEDSVCPSQSQEWGLLFRGLVFITATSIGVQNEAVQEMVELSTLRMLQSE